jgi:hypothetical protein
MNITNWFTGVVEDVNDPIQMGRVRVRCFNYHSASMADIPTQDLPWATCILPVTSPSIAGVGQSATGLLPGSWVFGFFRDALELQDPVVVGSIPSSSTTLPGERGNGFADPHGSYPNVLGNDIPAGATTYGYGANDGFQTQQAAFRSFNSAAVGQGTTATSLHGPLAPIQVNGSVDKIINAARGEVGVVETSENQGPGIQKYWTATNYPGGYNDRAYWCAAFVCWCVKQSGIFSEADRPKSASCFKAPDSFEAWARTKSPNVVLTTRPQRILAGDIVIFSFSHIGIATSASDLNGVFRTIEGNTNTAGARNGIGVFEKSRNISVIRSSITIGATPTTASTPTTTFA